MRVMCKSIDRTDGFLSQLKKSTDDLVATTREFKSAGKSVTQDSIKSAIVGIRKSCIGIQILKESLSSQAKSGLNTSTLFNTCSSHFTMAHNAVESAMSLVEKDAFQSSLGSYKEELRGILDAGKNELNQQLKSLVADIKSQAVAELDELSGYFDVCYFLRFYFRSIELLYLYFNYYFCCLAVIF